MELTGFMDVVVSTYVLDVIGVIAGFIVIAVFGVPHRGVGRAGSAFPKVPDAFAEQGRLFHCTPERTQARAVVRPRKADESPWPGECIRKRLRVGSHFGLKAVLFTGNAG